MNEGYDGIASPLSDEQNTYMTEMFDHDERIWYGPTCQGSECNKISTWSLPYSNFHSGQPNCNKASCNVCARSQIRGYTSWNDGNCGDKYRFVCRSAIWNLVSGDYFMAVDAPMTHSSAVEFCESQTTSYPYPVLASPQTPDQKTYMENQFPDQKIWFGYKCTSGCNDVFNWPGVIRLMDGAVDKPWAAGQPNCGSNNCNVCARSQTVGGQEWNDGNCAEKWSFLCRKDSIHWYLGGEGQSCDTVCEAKGATCEVATMKGLDVDGLEGVAKYLGRNEDFMCDLFPLQLKFDWVPAFDTGRLYCTAGSDATTCAASVSLYPIQRFCSCKHA